MCSCFTQATIKVFIRRNVFFFSGPSLVKGALFLSEKLNMQYQEEYATPFALIQVNATKNSGFEIYLLPSKIVFYCVFA